MASDHCFTPAPPAQYLASGSVERWGDLNVYANCPPPPTCMSMLAAVVLISDIYGWEAPLFRKLADKVAAAGFLVLVPDLLYGDSYNPALSETITQWTARHPADKKPVEDSKMLVEALKARGITSIGFAGFCWGGKTAVIMGRESSIKAIVLLHPTQVTLEDIKAIQVPTAILAAELDEIIPVSLIEEYRAILASEAKVEYFVKIYPGVGHGWTVRYNASDEVAVKKAEEAQNDMLAWFQKHM